MRYAISGSNTTVVSGGSGSATGLTSIAMGGHPTVTTGRVFWLTGMFYPRGLATQEAPGICLYDSTGGVTVVGQTPKLIVQGATEAENVTGGMYSFSPPGIKFSTGVSVRIGATEATGVSATANNIGAFAFSGYEE